MKDDFVIALFVGWLILIIFWFGSLLFIYVRKPPKSKLTAKLFVYSIIVFLLGFLFLWIVSVSDSFLV